jgi:hypothetical protein
MSTRSAFGVSPTRRWVAISTCQPAAWSDVPPRGTGPGEAGTPWGAALPEVAATLAARAATVSYNPL